MMIFGLAAFPAASYAAQQEDDENPREFNVKESGDNAAPPAESAGDQIAASPKKEKIVQVGSLEKIEGKKYILKKTQSDLEFYIDDSAKIYIKADGSAADLNDRCFIEIKGPHNKKAVLANTIYIYPDRKIYEEISDNAGADKKIFSAAVKGTIKSKDPLVIISDDDKEYSVCPDDDTFWIKSRQSVKQDLMPGDRLKVYFDKKLSVRYKSEAVKVVIDKSKPR
jgi:predicted nucleotide-binding protein